MLNDLGWKNGLLLVAVWLFAASSAAAQDNRSPQPPQEADDATVAATSDPASPPPAALPDLSFPPDADLQTLSQVITRAKAATPQSLEQYKTMMTAIRDAARAQLKLLADRKESAEYRQAELESITASVALSTYFSEKEQQELIEQVHRFLKGRKPLSLADVQTGMMAAAMLELQPDKQPARATYELLDELLEEDERPEMQSLRLNLQAAVRRLDLLGAKLELQAQTLDGQQIRIADYAGKFVLVDFFATWCEPCLAEIPRLQKYYQKYGERGLEVIGISLDADAEALGEYLTQANLPWPVVHDNAEDPLQRIQMQLGISSLPTVLLLNKEGTVVSLEASGAELDRLMQMLFESPTPAPPPTSATPPASTPPTKD